MRFQRLLHALIEVPESLSESQRGRARLLAALLIALTVPLLSGFVTLIVVALTTPTLLTAGAFEVVGFTILLALLAYWLNRRGHYLPAATFTVAAPAIGVWVLVLASRNNLVNASYAIPYVLVSVILTSLLLPPQTTALLSAVHIVGVLVAPLFVPGMDSPFVANTIGLLGFISLFTLIVSIIRQRDAARIDEQSRRIAEREQRYRSIFENAQEGIWTIDAMGLTTYINNQMAEMLGYTEPEMLGHSVYEFVDQAVLQELEVIFADLREGQAGHFDLRLRRKDGADLWTIVASQPMFDDSGRYTGALGLFTDINERKRTEQALRESEERFEYASWATRDVIRDWNLVTDEIWWSDGLQTVFQYQTGERRYDHDWWSATIHPDDLDKVVKSVKVIIDRGGQFWSKEYRFRKADGTYADIFDRGYILYDAQNRPKRFIGAMTDITVRKQAEAALLESEARFKGAFDNAAIGMALVALDGRWIQVNQAVCDLFGYSASELLEKNLRDLAHPSDAEADLNDEQALLAGSIRSYHIEKRYFHKQGEVVWVLLSKSLVRDFQDTPLYFICHLMDISWRKEAETALREVNTKLAQGLSELEWRNREMAQLKELGDVLQACMNIEEATATLDQSLRHLFPNDTGGLYIVNESRSLVEVMTKWGDQPLGEDVFNLRDCWALRRGRLYLATALSAEPICNHLSIAPTNAYLCVPLMAQNEILGLLHLQCAPQANESEPFPSAKQQLAQMVADSVALALANLRLRAAAQQESVRDPLTGLFNRRYLDETLDRELARAMRTQQPVGVIMIDVDHFKQFNDTLGHETGDTLLRELGRFLQQHSREGDIVCRYGGEEFTLVLPGASLAIAQQRAELLRVKARHLHLKYQDQSLGRITLSLGVAVYPDHGSIGGDLVRAADVALYRAKNEGRNRVVIADAASLSTS